MQDREKAEENVNTFGREKGKIHRDMDTADYKRLEEYMNQVLRQNGLWSWELDLKEHKLEYFANGNPFGIPVEKFLDVPESLFNRRIVLEEDWPICQKMFDELYGGKEQVKVQYRSWSRKYEDYIWFEYHFSVIERENGVPVRAIGTSRNVSAQKKIEQLYKEEQKNLLAIDDSLIASSRVNLSQGWVESMLIQGEDVSTDSVKGLLDYKERISIYLDGIQLPEKDNHALSTEYLLDLYKSGARECEKHFVARKKSSKQSICVRVNCKILERPESGDIIAFFYERDETIAYINQLTMSTVLQKDYEMTAVLFVHTRQYRVINEGVQGDLFFHGMIDYNLQLENFRNLVKKEEADYVIEQISFEKVMQMLKDSPLYTIECDMVNGDEVCRKQIRFSYADREKNIILITRRDIDDVVQSGREKQHQMEDALNLAERANNAKSEFLATISHEIRTPLNVIIGMTQLAQEEADDHKAVLEYIDEIRLSGRHLLNLVNNVLDMSKIESGEFSLQPQRYSFAELQKNVSTMFTPFCAQKNIEFVTMIYGEQPDMLVDKMRLNQVIFNLLNNAVEYTNENGQIQFVTLNQCKDNEMETKFIIQDTGIGMSKEFQEQMFKPFTRENNVAVSSSQGTGLGLSISKGIVDKMGGELSVTSVMGRGTTFCVRITMPIAGEYKAEVKDTKVQEADFSGRRILVVEDHNLNQVIITKLLTKKGAEVIVSENGKLGVEEFICSAPGTIDAILMDVRMPVMDGLQAARVIRRLNRPDAASVPIIAMTANAYDEDRQKSSAAGMNEHLAKPIDTKVLYEMLEKYLVKK